MIEFDNVSFAYNEKLLMEGFNNRVMKGEHIAIIGESGAGKSTLLCSLMGLVTPKNGVIRVEGKVLDHNSIHSIRGCIAWVPQEIQLPYDTVKEALLSPYSLKVNQGKKFDEQKMNDCFDKISLCRSVFAKKMSELSGGERQRLMIVSSILLEKKILLLDEPTSALDPDTKRKLINFLRSLDVTLLAVTHDMELAEICDRKVVLNKLNTTSI